MNYKGFNLRIFSGPRVGEYCGYIDDDKFVDGETDCNKEVVIENLKKRIDGDIR